MWCRRFTSDLVFICLTSIYLFKQNIKKINCFYFLRIVRVFFRFHCAKSCLKRNNKNLSIGLRSRYIIRMCCLRVLTPGGSYLWPFWKSKDYENKSALDGYSQFCVSKSNALSKYNLFGKPLILAGSEFGY